MGAHTLDPQLPPVGASPDILAAFARFHSDVAAAHQRLARALAPEAPAGPVLGFRQQEAMDFLFDRPDGATAKEVADALGVDLPNSYTLLGSLVQRALARVVASQPRRWAAVAPDEAAA